MQKHCWRCPQLYSGLDQICLFLFHALQVPAFRLYKVSSTPLVRIAKGMMDQSARRLVVTAKHFPQPMMLEHHIVQLGFTRMIRTKGWLRKTGRGINRERDRERERESETSGDRPNSCESSVAGRRKARQEKRHRTRMAHA